MHGHMRRRFSAWQALAVRLCTTILRNVVFHARFSKRLHTSPGHQGDYVSRHDAENAQKTGSHCFPLCDLGVLARGLMLVAAGGLAGVSPVVDGSGGSRVGLAEEADAGRSRGLDQGARLPRGHASESRTGQRPDEGLAVHEIVFHDQQAECSIRTRTHQQFAQESVNQRCGRPCSLPVSPACIVRRSGRLRQTWEGPRTP